MANTANKLSTPALIPWIPPGKPKESSSNVFVNKKNSGGYDYGSSIASSTVFNQPKKKNVSLNTKFWSPKKNSRKLTLGPEKERRIESLLNSTVNSQAESDLLRSKILGIFDEAEEKDGTQGDKERQNRMRHNSDPGNPSKNQSDGNGSGNGKVPGYNHTVDKKPSDNFNNETQRRPTTYNKDDDANDNRTGKLKHDKDQRDHRHHRERSRSHSRSRRNNSGYDEGRDGYRHHREHSRSHSRSHKRHEDDIDNGHHNKNNRNHNSSANKDTRGGHKHARDPRVLFTI